MPTEVTRTKRRARLSSVAVMAVSAALLASCAGTPSPDATATAGGEDSALVTVNVAVSQSAATSAPMYLAVEKGIFRDLGLDVQLTVGSPPTAIPQIVSGQNQFSIVPIGQLIEAVASGIDVKYLGTAQRVPMDGDYGQAFIVPADSTRTDLAGVTSLATISVMRSPIDEYAVSKLGGDYHSMNLLQVPFGSVAQTVASGGAEVGWLLEPFLSEALATGDVKVLSYYGTDLAIPGSPGAVFVSSNDYLTSNPEVAAKFIEGMEQAYSYAQANRDEVSEYSPKTGLTEQPVPVDLLGEYPDTPVTAEKLQEIIDLYKQFGYMDSPPSAQQLMYQP